MILLIDDDNELLKSLHKRLALRGYAVKSAANGDDGLAARDGKTRIILVDASIEHQTKPLWSALIAPSAPVYLMTGHGEATIDVPGLKSRGAAGVLFKPFELDELLAILSALGITPATP